MTPYALCAVCVLLVGCGQANGPNDFDINELKFTDKSCPILDYFIIEGAWCSDGEIYVYDKRKEVYHHVNLQMAVY